MTNYEWLKSMSIEELATLIMCPIDAGMAEIECGECDCCTCCLKWLKEEMKGG